VLYKLEREMRAFVEGVWETTDGYKAITVILDEDMSEDDHEQLINAIKMLKGVSDIKLHVCEQQ